MNTEEFLYMIMEVVGRYLGDTFMLLASMVLPIPPPVLFKPKSTVCAKRRN